MLTDFATFCHSGDAHRLHKPGHLKMQVESNNYQFNQILVIYQLCNPQDYIQKEYGFSPLFTCYSGNVYQIKDRDVDGILRAFSIDLDTQYLTDLVYQNKAHYWKHHVINHLTAISQSQADYIVFADIDCWMVRQPANQSWITRGIEILETDPSVFIVSPNDGEPERKGLRMSQQMFLTRVEEFRNADFNRPNWDGNTDIPGGPMPEYWAMLEGRMELHCRASGQYRYVLGPEYRYWHHNLLTKDDYFETDLSKW